MTLALCEAKWELSPLQTCCVRALLSEQGKNDPAARFPLPAGSLPGPSATSPGSSLASSTFVSGPGGGKAFGSAPCLSGVQHYQGSRLVSSISRCLALLHSQVSSQDFLALGKTECLLEPSRPVFHLQPPGFDWVTVRPSLVSLSPSASPGEEALCVLLGLGREEAPGFRPQPGVLGLLQLQPRLGGGSAFQERAVPACLAKARMPTPNSPGP